MLRPVRSGGDGDGGGLGVERRLRDAGDRGFGIEEGGEAAAALRRAAQGRGGLAIAAIGPGGERDAGPFHAQGASATAEELIAFCRQRLAHFKCPRHVVFAELPKTSTGKVRKYELRERARAMQARGV